MDFNNDGYKFCFGHLNIIVCSEIIALLLSKMFTINCLYVMLLQYLICSVMLPKDLEHHIV